MPSDTLNAPSLSRRTAFAGLGASGLGLALGARPPSAAAQEFTTAGHALVGTWFLDNGTANLTGALDAFSLHADGTYIEANADGTVRLGAWEATGPLTATLTIEAYSRDEAGANLGAIIIRLNLQLDPDGAGYQAEGTIELIHPDGTASGQAGPATGTATRLVVEAPSPPVMTIDELFGGAASTPEATPAA
jgi:hypothetical protein